jgi:hypothetical protein
MVVWWVARGTGVFWVNRLLFLRIALGVLFSRGQDGNNNLLSTKAMPGGK